MAVPAVALVLLDSTHADHCAVLGSVPGAGQLLDIVVRHVLPEGTAVEPVPLVGYAVEVELPVDIAVGPVLPADTETQLALAFVAGQLALEAKRMDWMPQEFEQEELQLPVPWMTSKPPHWWRTCWQGLGRRMEPGFELLHHTHRYH